MNRDLYQHVIAMMVLLAVLTGDCAAQCEFGCGPVGLPGDHNEDGWVTHADYGLLAYFFGTDEPIPNRGLSGPISIADFAFYNQRFGNWDEISPRDISSSFLPFTISRFATADGNTQWILKSNVGDVFAAHVNIEASAPIRSIGSGSQYMSVPGFNQTGQIQRGISFGGNRAFAALGTKLGDLTSFINGTNFVSFFTTGTQPTTLSFSGEYGDLIQVVCRYCAYDSSFEETIVFDSPAQGTSPTNPVLPDIDDSDDFVFTDVPSGIWFDPPLVRGFEYIMDSESLFTSILDFPPGFDAPFRVTAEGMVLGHFAAGQSVDFVGLLGHGVERFFVDGISPDVDAEDPTAFPLRIAFNTASASFRMVAVPEPDSALLCGLGLILFLGLLNDIRRRKILVQARTIECLKLGVLIASIGGKPHPHNCYE